MAVVVGPERNWGGGGPDGGSNDSDGNFHRRPSFECHPTEHSAAVILITLGALGVGANLALMAVILLRKPLRRWVGWENEVPRWVIQRVGPCAPIFGCVLSTLFFKVIG